MGPLAVIVTIAHLPVPEVILTLAHIQQSLSQFLDVSTKVVPVPDVANHSSDWLDTRYCLAFPNDLTSHMKYLP